MVKNFDDPAKGSVADNADHLVTVHVLTKGQLKKNGGLSQKITGLASSKRGSAPRLEIPQEEFTNSGTSPKPAETVSRSLQGQDRLANVENENISTTPEQVNPFAVEAPETFTPAPAPREQPLRGDRQTGMQYGFNAGSVKDSIKYDIKGVAGAAVSAFAFGYLAMSLKDLAKGKTPRDLTKKETIFAALMQSGGAGILGDFFFNKVDRFGSGLAGTIAGPLAGEAIRAVTVVQSMLRGEFVQGGEDALRVALDNSPFINLWYTREALNWIVLYHLREMMSPGTLRRTERKLKEEFDQTYMISPTQNIRRGGGGSHFFGL